MRTIVTLLAGFLIACGAYADTIYLKNGVRFDGVATQQPDGVYRVQAGSRTLVYRESEIDRIERNDRTGHLDKDSIKAQWKQRDQELTRLTGLNAEQRRHVDALLAKLAGAETPDVIAVRERLIAMQQEMDVLRYIEFLLPDMSYAILPQTLEILCQMDAGRALKSLRAAALHPFFAAREKALELLGRLRDRDSIPLMARGLLDETLDVRIAAAYALANAGGLEATLALIECLKHPDMRVANAGRESLEALWQPKYGDEKPRTVDEWMALWNAHASEIAAPISPQSLEPLIEPGTELHVS